MRTDAPSLIALREAVPPGLAHRLKSRGAPKPRFQREVMAHGGSKPLYLCEPPAGFLSRGRPTRAMPTGQAVSASLKHYLTRKGAVFWAAWAAEESSTRRGGSCGPGRAGRGERPGGGPACRCRPPGTCRALRFPSPRGRPSPDGTWAPIFHGRPRGRRVVSEEREPAGVPGACPAGRATGAAPGIAQVGLPASAAGAADGLRTESPVSDFREDRRSEVRLFPENSGTRTARGRAPCAVSALRTRTGSGSRRPAGRADQNFNPPRSIARGPRGPR
jgi:hypothetical protein